MQIDDDEADTAKRAPRYQKGDRLIATLEGGPTSNALVTTVSDDRTTMELDVGSLVLTVRQNAAGVWEEIRSRATYTFTPLRAPTEAPEQ